LFPRKNQPWNIRSLDLSTLGNFFFYTIKENLHLLSKMAGLATFTHVVLTMVKTGLGKNPPKPHELGKIGQN